MNCSREPAFLGSVVTYISCPHHSLPVHWAIAPRAVLAQRGRWSWMSSQAHSWLVLACSYTRDSHSCVSTVQLYGVALSILLDCPETPLSSSADAHTSEKAHCRIPPAPQSSVGNNYLHVSLCLARANDPISSLLLTALSAPQQLMISFQKLPLTNWLV